MKEEDAATFNARHPEMCTYCCNPGHWKRECPVRAENERRRAEASARDNEAGADRLGGYPGVQR